MPGVLHMVRDGCCGARLQRTEVVIDACMLSGSESTFLQQATHLTGGIYLRPKLRGALLQYLLVRFLMERHHSFLSNGVIHSVIECVTQAIHY